MPVRCVAISGLLCLVAAAPLAHAQAAPHATRNLERGHALRLADITSDSTDPATRRVVGWVTRRAVRTGEPLRSPAIGPPPMVRTGETISIQLVAAGIRLTREGTALTSGSLGDRVRIQLANDRSLTGVVAGPSTVRIQ